VVESTADRIRACDVAACLGVEKSVEHGPGSDSNGWGREAPQSWVEQASPFDGVMQKTGGGADVFSRRVRADNLASS
jgi:hypothetical protein